MTDGPFVLKLHETILSEKLFFFCWKQFAEYPKLISKESSAPNHL